MMKNHEGGIAIRRQERQSGRPFLPREEPNQIKNEPVDLPDRRSAGVPGDTEMILKEIQ